MKYVGLIAVLAMACILVMPAFSMSDQNDGKKMDCKFIDGKMPGQDNICPQCGEPMGPMGDDGKKICQCKGMNGEHKFGPESMKDDKKSCHKSIKSMMDGKRRDGEVFCHKPIKSMMDGKCQGPMGPMGDDGKQMTECQGPMGSMGDDGKQMTECQGPMGSMGDDGKQQMTQCQNKDGGEKFGPKSMMDGKEMDGNAPCHKPVKSMMGDEKRCDGKGERGETTICMCIRQ
jgi:hypothetical protein